LLPSDTTQSGSIYEIAGVGTESPEPRLRLLTVACPPANQACSPEEETQLALYTRGKREGPYLGDRRRWAGSGATAVLGTAYHAVSESGETVFFTATPAPTPVPEGFTGIKTIFARVGSGTASAHTVAVSVPSSACTGPCASSEPSNATFQGASADGSKVFFTTAQPLIDSDTNNAPDLYEYEFNAGGNKLILLSGGKPETGVTGVVRTSPDGSHVYFVAAGVLTTEPNGNGETAQEQSQNLYGYDTGAGKTKFVASPGAARIRGGLLESTDEGPGEEGPRERYAQTTPDGRYLVFSSPAMLAGNTSNGTAQAVYRYAFQTGELKWVSHAAPGFTPVAEAKDALVAALPGSADGSEASIGDWNRAISDNGEYVIFTTAEKLQADDINQALDVYEWHNGTVSMISGGHDPQGGRTSGVGEVCRQGKPCVVTASGMSASGSDIFFLTHTPLVGQDTDVLVDLYDARVEGGFPAPPPAEASCSGEPCQGASAKLPSFGSAASSLFPAAGNLTAPGGGTLPIRVTKPKPLSRAQLLARALKACKGKPKKKRAACVLQAKRKYGSKAKAKKRKPRRK
jgi:hypothetical protein